MKCDDSVYLQHGSDVAIAINPYLAGVDEPQFLSEQMRQDAAIRQRERIGEAVKQLSSEVRA